MKTLEKLYEEIQADSELKKEYVKAIEDKTIIDFLKAYDCDATEAELDAFILSKNNKELADDELDMVSGGGACTFYDNLGRPYVSAFNSCRLYNWMGGDRSDSGYCKDCSYSVEDVYLTCHNPKRQHDVDEV